jgi:hypothetical protein
MDRSTRQQHMLHMREFLREKMRSPDVSGEVIVHRNEIEEHAREAGVDEQAAWQIFTGLKGQMWQGEYIPGTHSDARGYLGARLTRVT